MDRIRLLRTPVPTRRVAVVGFPDAQTLDLTGPHEVFSGAARWLSAFASADSPAYDVLVAARAAEPLRMGSGLTVGVDRRLADLDGPLDTLLVAGGFGVEAALADGETVPALRRLARRARRVASVCTGAFLLAEAGLLEGRRATTHWAYCDELARRYPSIRVERDPIFVRDGRVYTSAGVTAGMDLALALVEEDLGKDVALQVARWLVMFLKRPGGQSQFSAQLDMQLADRAPLKELQAWIADHPAEDLSVEALARRAAMSPRNFARVFAREVGATPARFVEKVRVEAARRRLEETDLGVDAVAAACGFGGAETMRRAFLRELRVNPADYRRRFRGAA